MTAEECLAGARALGIGVGVYHRLVAEMLPLERQAWLRLRTMRADVERGVVTFEAWDARAEHLASVAALADLQWMIESERIDLLRLLAWPAAGTVQHG